MDKSNNEISRFIYEICYPHIWSAVSDFLSKHLALLDLSYSRIKYPDSALIEDLLLEFTRNIRIDEDKLLFDAIISCTINLTENNYRGFASFDINQWFTVSCEALVTDRLERLNVSNVIRYTPGNNKPKPGQTVSTSIVPILYKKDLEEESRQFLEKYYPDALEKPMPVPIEDIAVKMGLEIIQGNRITDDFSVFGEIYFSSGKANVYDLFKISEKTVDVRRGTILVDAYTFWERNLGCVNNTIAHEVYHWYKHRMYAAIKHILYGKDFVACRCPSDMAYPQNDKEWTDIQRMEWQANKMAPRILMPAATFKIKVDELYKQYNYKDSPLKLAVLTCIADELAKFYGVSRQSALIRMVETGYKEAAGVYQGISSKYHAYISREDAFHAYSNNKELQELIDSGLFKYVDNYYFVINDPQFIESDDSGVPILTDYAWSHLEECTLQFSWATVTKPAEHRHLPAELMHRANSNQAVSDFDSAGNKDVISAAIKRKREEFERQNAQRKLSRGNKTCWEAMHEIIESRGISKSHFCSLTGLDEIVYRRAISNHHTKPSLRTIVAFARGLDLNIEMTEWLLQLAGHAFDDSDEHQALKFCITGFSGQSIEDCNEFLNSYEYAPLGSQQRI
ncbi:MAG: ImmA/IrrE family metallo-endopeptidase [Eubacteriales bacterium]|nr:ImmA/IrrE family metallo-endopeptidase [Eubacteriales bacterium]